MHAPRASDDLLGQVAEVVNQATHNMSALFGERRWGYRCHGRVTAESPKTSQGRLTPKDPTQRARRRLQANR